MGDLVERVAAAAWEVELATDYVPATKIKWASLLELARTRPTDKHLVLEYRAIARAIIPMVLEEAAKVAEEAVEGDRRRLAMLSQMQPDASFPALSGGIEAADEIAAAIRAIQEQCNGR